MSEQSILVIHKRGGLWAISLWRQERALHSCVNNSQDSCPFRVVTKLYSLNLRGIFLGGEDSAVPHSCPSGGNKDAGQDKGWRLWLHLLAPPPPLLVPALLDVPPA